VRASRSLVVVMLACLLVSAGFAQDRAELAAVAQDARASWKLPFVTVNFSQPDQWLARATQLLVSSALETQRDAVLVTPDAELLALLNLTKPVKWPEERLDIEQRLVDALMVFHADVGELCYLGQQEGQLSATLLRLTPMDTDEVQVTGTPADMATFLSDVVTATLKHLCGQNYQAPATPLIKPGISAAAAG
jgi:hypothetical protein